MATRGSGELAGGSGFQAWLADVNPERPVCRVGSGMIVGLRRWDSCERQIGTEVGRSVHGDREIEACCHDPTAWGCPWLFVSGSRGVLLRRNQGVGDDRGVRWHVGFRERGKWRRLGVMRRGSLGLGRGCGGSRGVWGFVGRVISEGLPTVALWERVCLEVKESRESVWPEVGMCGPGDAMAGCGCCV